VITQWSRKALGELLSVQNGYAFDSKYFGVKGFPLIRIRDLKVGASTETRYAGDFDAKYVVNAGDFLIGMDGEFGCYEWKGEPALLNQRVCRLQGFDHALEPRFLFYGINAHLKAIEEVTGYTTVKHLSSKQIVSIEMLVPARDEQRRIVAILDEAFEGIATAKANAEKNLQNANESFEYVLQETFDVEAKIWPAQTLGDLCDLVTDGTHNSPPYVESGVAMLDSKHIGNDFDIDDGGADKFISREIDAQLSRRCKPCAGDVLISSRGTIGKIAIVKSGQDFNIMGNMILLRFPSHVDSHFMAFYVLSRVAHIETIARGVAQKGLYLGQVREYEVPVPPLEEQRRIASKLLMLRAQSAKLSGIFHRKLSSLDELRKSLLHQAFTGQL
jgi:type I restriction enzyme, S subunit